MNTDYTEPLIVKVTDALISSGGELLIEERPARAAGAWVDVEACGSILTLHAPRLFGSVVAWTYEDYAGEFRSVDDAEDWIAYCANGMVADWGNR